MSRPRENPAHAELLTQVASPNRDDARIAQCLGAGVDWESALRLSGLHYVTSQLAVIVAATRGAEMPPHIRRVLDAAFEEAIHRHRLQILILGNLLDEFGAAGIPVLLIKGPGLAERFYANPVERYSVDLDLLVRPGDVAAAGEILGRFGYSGFRPDFFRRRHFHIPYFNEGYPSARVIEVHWDVTLPESAVRFDMARWWREAREHRFRFGRAMLPPLEDEVAYQAYHAFSRGRVALRDLADAVRLLEHASTESSIDRCVASAGEAGAGLFLALARNLGRSIWGTLGETGSEGWDEGGLGRRWLARNVFSPSTVVATGAALWWPYRKIASWSLAPPQAGGPMRLLKPDLDELADPTGRLPDPSPLRWIRHVLTVACAVGLCCLPRRWFPASLRIV